MRAVWVAEEVARLRGLSYSDLLKYEDKALHCEMLSATTGEVLIRETQVFWDDERARTLRVLVDVWRPKGRVIRGSLAGGGFIRAADESFVGE